MTTEFTFLQRLSLSGDADERAIRRAYARELKLIDQEADPAGFQSLREAYETALYWARHKEEFVAEEFADAPTQPELEAAVGMDLAQPAPIQVPAPRPPDYAAADHPPANPPRERLDTDHDALAEAVFADFLRRAAAIAHERPITPDLPWQRELRASLDDPRLINIVARETFERRVADLLVSGWRPGLEALLVAAVNTFGWSGDRRRVFSLGRSGAILDAAIDERATFDLQPDAQRDDQRRLIERLRDPKPPGTRELVRNSATLETLIARFPTWLALITDVDNIVRWREQNDKLPPWRRQLTFTGVRKPAGHSYEHQKKSTINWGWVIVLGLVALIRFLAHDGGDDASRPDEASKYFNHGTQQLNNDDATGAIANFTRVLELKPDDAQAHGNRAAAYLATGQDRLASEDIEKMAALDAKNPLLDRLRGVLALRTGHYNEAIDAFTRALELAPNHDMMLLSRAQAYTSIGELDKALADIDETLKVSKKPGAAPYMLRMKIFSKQNNDARALAQIEPMLAAAPADTDAYIAAAELHMRLNQRELARTLLDRGVVAAPDAAIYLYRAEVRPRSDKPGRQQDIDSGIALAPHSVYANRLRAELEADNGRYDDALATLTNILKDNKAYGPPTLVLVDRGVVHIKMGNQPLANADFEQARKAAKTATQLNSVAWEMATRNVALPTALSIINEALEKEPDYYAAIDSKAFILLRLGQYREAIEQYDEALRLQPKLAQSLFGRGIAKRRAGQRASDDTDLKAARAVQPDIDAEFAAMGMRP
ncbi:tetratricopeptide repeat protein [Burkholderia sp. LMU1-1-1.1]|uniref:tetratricopeptide repeat protein n=1 Tax=Burkholderia sp. LMU1-1-1.1 TaxID=3135266 RepID=UPI0034185A8B